MRWRLRRCFHLLSRHMLHSLCPWAGRRREEGTPSINSFIDPAISFCYCALMLCTLTHQSGFAIGVLAGCKCVPEYCIALIPPRPSKGALKKKNVFCCWGIGTTGTPFESTTTIRLYNYVKRWGSCCVNQGPMRGSGMATHHSSNDLSEWILKEKQRAWLLTIRAHNFHE